jgi:hypothetical protein
MTSVTRRDLVKSMAAAPALMAGLNFVAGGAAADETKTGAGAASIPTERFDFVIAGAGHNSLTCGAYLAKAGYRVLILEGHQAIGGGCKTQEVLLPGFKEDLCSSCHTVILRNPLAINNELDLDQYGYELLHPEVVLHYVGAEIQGEEIDAFGAWTSPDLGSELFQSLSQLLAVTSSNFLICTATLSFCHA